MAFRLPAALALTLGMSLFQPAGNEDAIVHAVDAHNADALALLERAVDINSGTMNFEGVREVGRLFRAELDTLGFKTEWLDGTAWHRAGHLVATHPGNGPKFLLIGHLGLVDDQPEDWRTFVLARTNDREVTETRNRHVDD